jgi:hypothetical protein
VESIVVIHLYIRLNYHHRRDRDRAIHPTVHRVYYKIWK